MRYIPNSNKRVFFDSIEPDFMGHLTYVSGEHTSALIKYVRSGGSYTIPCPDIVLSHLLSLSSIDNNEGTDAISSLLENSPYVSQKMIWDFISDSKFEPDSLILLAKVVQQTHSLPLPDGYDVQLLKGAISKMSNPSSPFVQQEAGLCLMRYIVRSTDCRPWVLPSDYSNPSIEALAIDCWAEYVANGHKDELPVFRETNHKTLQFSLLNLFCNSQGLVDCPHWISRCVHDHSYQPEESILSLSVGELGLVSSISNRLPDWFFVHCLRARTPRLEIVSKLVDIVSEAPSEIINTFINDFLSFLSFCCSSGVTVCTCLRTLYVSLGSNFDLCVLHVAKGIDFFDPESISIRLESVAEVLPLVSDVSLFNGVARLVIESITLLELSQGVCSAMLRFLGAIASHNIALQPDIARLCQAVVASMFFGEEPLEVSQNPIAHAFYEACVSFHSIDNSDIISNPEYSLKDCFPLASLALTAFCELPCIYAEPISSRLAEMVAVCPAECMAIAMKLTHCIDLVSFCSSVRCELSHNRTTAFVMLCGSFQVSIRSRAVLDTGGLLVSNLTGFSDNINETRLTLKADFVTAPVLMMKPTQLTLLMERWAPTMDSIFIAALEHSRDSTKSWRDKKRYDEVAKRLKNIKEEEKINYELYERMSITREETFESIQKKIPSPKGGLLPFLKLYRKEKTVSNHVKKLVEEDSDIKTFAGEHLWLYQILGHEGTSEWKIRIAKSRLSITEIKGNELWAIEENTRYQIRKGAKKIDDVYKESGSATYASKFISKTCAWTMQKELELLTSRRPSICCRIIASIWTVLNKGKLSDFLKNGGDIIVRRIEDMPINNVLVFEDLLDFLMLAAESKVNDPSVAIITDHFLSEVARIGLLHTSMLIRVGNGLKLLSELAKPHRHGIQVIIETLSAVNYRN